MLVTRSGVESAVCSLYGDVLCLRWSGVLKQSIISTGPTINRRQTNTTVTVKNGQTIVLSGIRNETEQTIKRKVPVLGDIPVLDLIFASDYEQSVVTETVIFITPIVVDNPDDNDVNFNELDRQRLEQLSEPLSEGARQLQRRLGVKGVDSPAATDPRRD